MGSDFKRLLMLIDAFSVKEKLSEQRRLELLSQYYFTLINECNVKSIEALCAISGKTYIAGEKKAIKEDLLKGEENKNKVMH